MKWSLSIFALLIAFSACAEDAYLRWMVDTEDEFYSARATDPSYVKVKGFGDSSAGYLNLYSQSGAEAPDAKIGTDIVEGYAKAENMAFYASLAGCETYSSFVVELYNASGLVAQSDVLTYSSAQAYIQYGGISAPSAPVWMAGGFVAPEPNSGLLVLLGCAILGLKRKKLTKGC